MKKFLRFKLWPVLAGLITAFIVMIVFEYVNSYFFPLPQGLDTTDMSAVYDFTKSLPWTAYILVLAGWIVGSFKAGCVTTYLARETSYKMSFVVGVVLTMIGVINNLMIGHAMYFNLIGLPMFLIFTYLGHRYLLKVHKERGLFKE